MNKEYVYIQSSISIVVTAGLQYDNVTNPDAHVPDRLKVNPLWPKLRMMLKKGQHIYPSLITEWASVKALEKDGIITIGAYVDAPEDEAMKTATTDLKDELAKVNKKQKIVKDITLDEVSK